MKQETLGERLRRLRLAAGVSLRALAEPEYSGAYVSRIEVGARNPSVKALRVFAPRLGVSAHYLETGEDDVNLEDLVECLRGICQRQAVRIEELELSQVGAA